MVTKQTFSPFSCIALLLKYVYHSCVWSRGESGLLTFTVTFLGSNIQLLFSLRSEPIRLKLPFLSGIQCWTFYDPILLHFKDEMLFDDSLVVISSRSNNSHLEASKQLSLVLHAHEILINLKCCHCQQQQVASALQYHVKAT